VPYPVASNRVSVSYSAIAPRAGSLLVDDAPTPSRPTPSRPSVILRNAPTATLKVLTNMPGRMPKSGRNSNSRSANHPPAVTISANQQFLGIAVDEFGMSQVVNTTVSSMNGGRSQLYANNADNASTDDINESADDNKSTMVIALLISGVVFVIVIGIIRFIFGWRQRQQQDMVDYQHVHQTGQQEQHLYSDAGSGADGIRSQERAWERANERLSRSLQTRSDDRTPLHVVQIAS
jgi:hypothetical protein